LWAAALGNRGYHRLYRYAPPAVEEPVQRWDLTDSYQSLIMDDELIVAYNYNPLTVQVLDLASGELQAVQTLEQLEEKPLPSDDVSSQSSKDETDEQSVTEATESLIATPDIIWYRRSEPLVHNGWFYLAEQRPFKPQTAVEKSLLPSPLPENTELVQWILRSWNLKAKEAKEARDRSIPGEPVAFTAAGDLITREATTEGKLRLNRVALPGAGNARLIESRELPCTSYSQMQWTGQSLYLTCNTETDYWYELPTVMMEDEMADAGGDEGVSPVKEEEPKEETKPEESKEESKPEESKEEPKPEEPKEEPEPVEPTMQVLKLDPEQGFAESGQWTLPGIYGIRAASEEIVLVSPEWWYYPMPMVDVVDGVSEPAMVKSANTRSSLMPYSNNCVIYRLVAGQEPQLLKELDNCPSQQTVTLTDERAWMAEGFAGIKEINW
jgi:hypothetical protein